MLTPSTDGATVNPDDYHDTCCVQGCRRTTTRYGHPYCITHYTALRTGRARAEPGHQKKTVILEVAHD